MVAADQVTKLIVRGLQIPFLGINLPGMPLYASKEVIGDFLRLTYIENPGMAFGIDFGWKSFFAVFSIVASIAILLYLYKVRQENRVVRFSLALILGGAIGNLIDRVFYGPLFEGTSLFHGRVVDFIDFDFFNVSLFGYNFSRFPVFNLADAAVTIGVVMLLIFHRRAAVESEIQVAPAEDAGQANSAATSGSVGQGSEPTSASKG